MQVRFEQMFLAFGTNLLFTYLPSFYRVRVTYGSADQAQEAKKFLNGADFEGSTIGVYIVQVK